MISFEKNVIQALQKAVVSAVEEVYPVKFVGRNAPEHSGKWWEIVYIPDNVENEFWADGKTYRGILRLVLHWSQDDQGVEKALDEAARISLDFSKGSVFEDDGQEMQVRIVDHPNVLSVIEERSEMIIPLTIRYSSFKIIKPSIVVKPWILISGFWVDSGEWIDTEIWVD